MIFLEIEDGPVLTGQSYCAYRNWRSLRMDGVRKPGYPITIGFEFGFVK